MIALISVALAVALQTAAAPSGASPAAGAVAQARSRLATTRQELISHFDAIEQRSGLAVMLETRLDEDTGVLDDVPTSKYYTLEEYAQDMSAEAGMLAGLVHQLASGQYRDWSAVRGLEEVVVRSPIDGTMQPAAIYVPASYDATKAAPLVVLLHGRTQSEMDILAVKWFRQLADSTGAIVVAPYGRGDSQYEDPAPLDVYATLDAARAAFTVDPKRTYLAGYSMGGYGVFTVGLLRSQEWAGFLAIAGGPTSSNEQAVFVSFASKPVYLVSGVEDAIIPNSYIRLVARVLRDRGIPTGYYEQANGTHSLATIFPAISRAWSDMLHGAWPHGSLPGAGALPAQTIHPD